MTITTPETIQSLSVDIVKDFVANKIPLNEGIAKVASEMELNPEQIKRLVETCNTVTYLSLQKTASDRTSEFAIADYKNVLAKISLPEHADTSVIEQDFKEATASQKEEKQAEFQPDLQTIQAWTRTGYIRNKAMLEKLAIDSEAVVQNIGDLTTRIRKDQYALEKLAEVATEDEFRKLALLIKKIPEKLEDRIFKEAELSEVSQLVELYKKAQEINKETNERKELEKRAIASAISGALGKTLGGTVGLGAYGVTKGISNTVKGLGKSKIVHPVDLLATAVSKPEPSVNIWDNLQGRQKRF